MIRSKYFENSTLHKNVSFPIFGSNATFHHLPKTLTRTTKKNYFDQSAKKEGKIVRFAGHVKNTIKII